jgi:Ferric iron reductase FhuF-like transporter.
MAANLDFSLIKMYFHISPEGADHPILEMRGDQFLDMDITKQTLLEAGKLVQANGLDLPASFAGTSFAKLCATQLLMFAQYHIILDLTLPNLMFQTEAHDDHAHLGYRILELQTIQAPTEGQEAWLAAQVEQFIRETVRPAVNAIAQAAGVKPQMIWQQYGGVLAYVRDYVHENIPIPSMAESFETGYRVITELPAEAFGVRRNPFVHKPRYIASPYSPEDKLMMHSSCCMYDKRENGVKCYTCPMLTPNERESMRLEICAKAEAQTS